MLLEPNQTAGKTLMFSALALCLVALTYGAILSVPLISDDYYFFSPKVGERPWRFFYSDIFPNDPDATFLRPLPALVFALEQRLPGFLPVLPHVLNLLFHLVNTALLGILMRRLLKGRCHSDIPVVVGMLFFGLHPQVTGAVCWISARFDLMCVFFGALGFYFWRYGNKPSIWLRLASVTAFFCALMSKETGIAFPAALLVWEVGRMTIQGKESLTRSQVVSTGILFVATVFCVVFRLACFSQIGGYSNLNARSFSLESSLGYLIVMVWPFGKMGTTPSLWTYCAGVAMISILLFTAGARTYVRKQASIGSEAMDYAWLLPCLLCVSFLVLMGSLPLTVRQILDHAESRNSYGSLFGFAILLGYAVGRLSAIRFGRVLTSGFLVVFLSVSLWAQQVEISRWKAAGLRAKSILDQTVRLVPEPAEEALLIMSGIPMADKPSYYVFGMGLEEALQARYGREDIRVERWPSKELLKQPPDNSIVLRYSYKEDRMKIVKRTFR